MVAAVVILSIISVATLALAAYLLVVGSRNLARATGLRSFRVNSEPGEDDKKKPVPTTPKELLAIIRKAVDVLLAADSTDLQRRAAVGLIQLLLGGLFVVVFIGTGVADIIVAAGLPDLVLHNDPTNTPSPSSS